MLNFQARLRKKAKIAGDGGEEVQRSAWGALGEIVGMAERSAQLSLGRFQPPKRGKLPG